MKEEDCAGYDVKTCGAIFPRNEGYSETVDLYCRSSSHRQRRPVVGVSDSFFTPGTQPAVQCLYTVISRSVVY